MDRYEIDRENRMLFTSRLSFVALVNNILVSKRKVSELIALLSRAESKDKLTVERGVPC